MPIYNVTIDDISPVFIYSAGWVDTNTSDPSVSEYFNFTFHATPSVGSNVSVSFNGSAVWVGGAKRSNHGTYGVWLDGILRTFDGFADPDLFQIPLFSQRGLGNNLHVITLNDEGTTDNTSMFDIDFIKFTTGDGNNNTVLNDTTFDDSDPSIQYSEGWSTLATQETAFYFNQTSHTTNLTGAEVTIIFDGSAIAIYGATNVNHGGFMVSLDGGESQIFNSTAPSFRPQTLLYYASNLPNATHVLNLVNSGIAANQNTFDFDFAVVSQYKNPVAAPTDEATSQSDKSKVKAIVAGSILAAAIVLIAGLFLVLRRRRRRTTLLPASKPAPSPLNDSDSTSVPWINSQDGRPQRDVLPTPAIGMFPAIQTWNRQSQGLSALSPDDARSRPSEYLSDSEADSAFDHQTQLDTDSIPPPPAPSLLSMSTPHATAGSRTPPSEKRQLL